MHYRELIDRYSKSSGRTRVESKEIVDRLLEVIVDAILDREEINIYGIGRFYFKLLPSRDVRLFDGTYMKSKPKYKVCFKPSVSLEEKVNKAANEE